MVPDNSVIRTFWRIEEMSDFFQHYDDTILIPLITIVASVFIGIILRWIIGNWLGKLAAKTAAAYDDILVSVTARLTLYLTTIAGIYVALDQAPYARVVMPYVQPVLLTMLVLVLARGAVQILTGVIQVRADTSGSTIAVASLTRKIIQIVVYIIGGITILNFFGIAITPIITALGVGGLAVALALQDTLSNIFAGVYITLANQIRVGDYIKMENLLEGFVTDIGWRNTAVKPFDENLVIIPNNKLSQAIVTNYHLPKQMVRMKVDVRVDYSSDPEHVEQVLYSIVRHCGHENEVEAEREAQPAGKIRGLLYEPAPVVRFTAFNTSALDFSLSFAVSDFQYQYIVRHEIMKKIYYRFREEGITIPFPIQTVRLGDETVKSIEAMSNRSKAGS
jgi:small-conductance mechanosensitive channel